MGLTHKLKTVLNVQKTRLCSLEATIYVRHINSLAENDEDNDDARRKMSFN